VDDDETLRPAEVARQRRRDRDASAAERAGMRTGLAKTMKQIMDAQSRRGAEARRALEQASEREGDADSAGSRPDATPPRRRTARPGRGTPDPG